MYYEEKRERERKVTDSIKKRIVVETHRYFEAARARVVEWIDENGGKRKKVETVFQLTTNLETT